MIVAPLTEIAKQAELSSNMKTALDWLLSLGDQDLEAGRVEIDGDTAREAERFEMGRRIRAVQQGPEGAIWLLEDGPGGRLLRLTPH